MTAQDLYQRAIVEHHKQPRNAGRLQPCTHAAELHNALCGDRTVVTLRLAEGRLQAVCCETLGCAICRASGSMMTEALKGAPLPWALELCDFFLDLFSDSAAAGPPREVDEADVERLGPLSAFVEVRRHPSRTRCATLPWEALRRAVQATG